MHEVILSIIIPAYNCENTIANLLKSIESGLDLEHEVIIVDDGSTDNTNHVLKKLCLDKVNYKMFRQDNGGAPKARNNGLAQAIGKYIYFCDADDLINDTKVLVSMVSVAEKHKYEMVISDLISLDENGRKKERKAFYKRLCLLKDEKYFFCDPIPGTKLYRRSFLEKNKLHFDDVKIGQDLNFYIKAISVSTRVGYVQGNLYIYRYMKSGISRTYKLENLLQIKKSIAFIENYCRENTRFDKKMEKNLMYIRLTNYVWQLKKKKHVNKEEYGLLKWELLKEISLKGNIDIKRLVIFFIPIMEYILIKYFNFIVRYI